MLFIMATESVQEHINCQWMFCVSYLICFQNPAAVHKGHGEEVGSQVQHQRPISVTVLPGKTCKGAEKSAAVLPVRLPVCLVLLSR